MLDIRKIQKMQVLVHHSIILVIEAEGKGERERDAICFHLGERHKMEGSFFSSLPRQGFVVLF